MHEKQCKEAIHKLYEILLSHSSFVINTDYKSFSGVNIIKTIQNALAKV